MLYVLATGPLLLLVALGAWVDRATALQTARRQAENIARLGSSQQDDIVQEAHNLLAVLAMAPDIRGEGCHALLQRIDEGHPRMTNLSFYRPDGSPACNSRQQHPTVNVSDREYFRRAIASTPGETIGSEIVTSRVSGLPGLVVAVPVRDPVAGTVLGVLTTALNLDWFNLLAQRMSGTVDTVVDIIDLRSGESVARQPGRASVAGDEHMEPGLLAAVRAAPGGGSIEAQIGGIPHTVAFAPLLGVARPTVLVIGLPKTQVLAPSNTHLTLDMLGFTGAALAAVVLAWIAAARSLLQPIRRLVAATGSIGHDGAAVKVGPLPSAVRELQMLAHSVDEMADRLRIRDARIATMSARLVDSEEHHRLLANNVSDMIARFDRAFVRTYISPACQDIVGYSPDELVGQAMPNMVVDADRNRVKAELVRPLLAGSETARSTYRVACSDGRVVWLETFARRLPDNSGFVTVARDVSVQKALESKLETANQQLRIQVMQDPLTGIANRRRFDEMLGFEFRRAQRLGEPMSVLLADIDHFKSFNDLYGHAVGDECLRAVAVALDRTLRRPGDLAGRYGGEEFAVLLPGTDASGVMVVAERLRIAVSNVRITSRPSCTRSLTVSVGAATFLPCADLYGPAALVEAADAALYSAKRDGRDRVRSTVLAGLDAPTEPAPQT